MIEKDDLMKKIIVLLSILFWFFPACDSNKTKVVARVGNSLISLEQFEADFLESNSIQSLQNTTLQEKQKFLDKIIENKTKRLFASHLGIENHEGIKKQIEQVKQRSLFVATLEQLVMFKIIKEEEIRRFYDRSDKEVRIRHILLDPPPKDNPDSLQLVIQNATDLIERLRSGGDFIEVVKKYSIDEFTVKKGGDLGFLRWGSIDNVIMSAALKSAKYQIYPRPIVTSKGVHIIQVTDRRKVLQKPYQFEKGNIVRNLFNRRRNEVMAEFDRFNKELDKNHNVTYFDENMQKALGFITSPPNDSLFITNYRVQDPDYSWLSDDMRDIPLAQFDNQSVTLIDFFDLVSNMQNSPRPQDISNIQIIKSAIENKIRYDLTSQIGLRKNYLKMPNYQRQVDRQVSQIIVRHLQNNYINKLPPITEEMAIEYYNKKTNDYKIPAKAEVQEILVEDSTQALLVHQQAISGNDFDELVETHSTHPSRSKDTKGNLGFITENSYGELGKTAMQLEIGEIAGPIKLDGGYSIFRVLSRENEKLQSYEQLKTKVRSDLVREMRENNKEEWENKIRNIFRIRVYPEVLELALKNV